MIEFAGRPLLSAALQIPFVENLCPPAPVTSAERAACAVASWSGPAQVAALAGLGLLVGAAVVAGRRIHSRIGGGGRGYEDQPTIPIVFPVRPLAAGEAAPGSERAAEAGRWDRREDGDGPAEGDRPKPAVEPDAPAREPSRGDPAVAGAAKRTLESEDEPDSSPRDDPWPVADGGDGEAPGPARPFPRWEMSEEGGDGEHTLQLLPGRMEIVSGTQQGREIRFVNTTERRYTFGRQAGDEPGHVQLRNPTVSREHAAMRFVDGRWRIRNLSTTNPLLINGERPEAPGAERVLQDGDRIEMGEIVLLFRES